MKRQVLLLAACALAGLAHAQFIEVGWAGTPNTVHAEFTRYGLFNNTGSARADAYSVVDYTGNLLPGGLPGLDAPDLLSLGGRTTRFAQAGENWLETTANWDLSVWSPAIAGFAHQLFTFQIAYFADPAETAWRQNYELGIQLYHADPEAAGSLVGAVQRTSSYDELHGLVTEVFTFSTRGAADGVFIDIAAAPELSVGNPSYITALSLDSLSYSPAAVPEPSTYGLAGAAVLAAAILYRRRRR